MEKQRARNNQAKSEKVGMGDITILIILKHIKSIQKGKKSMDYNIQPRNRFMYGFTAKGELQNFRKRTVFSINGAQLDLHMEKKQPKT